MELVDKIKSKKLVLIQIEGGYKLAEMSNMSKQIVFIPEDDLHYHTTKDGVYTAVFINDGYTYTLRYSDVGGYWRFERANSTWQY